MRAMKRVEFYFDVGCPYAYLGATQIEAVVARCGGELVWRPMLLGGVFKAVGRQPAEYPPAKLRAAAEDLARWARRWGVPAPVYPAGHPLRTVEAMRLCVAAGERVPALAHALFRAYWIDHKDVANREVLAVIAAAHGLDIAEVDRDENKEGLRRNTDAAVADGVFGAPSFVVTNEHGRSLFWGQDRLHFVEKALNGWKVPA